MRYEATYTANAVSVRVVTYGMGWADIFSICMVEESNARVNLGGCSFTYSEPDVFFYLGFLHIRYSLPLFRVDASGGESPMIAMFLWLKISRSTRRNINDTEL